MPTLCLYLGEGQMFPSSKDPPCGTSKDAWQPLLKAGAWAAQDGVVIASSSALLKNQAAKCPGKS